MGAARIDQIFAFCPLISARCQGVGVGPGPRLLDVSSHSLQSCNPLISILETYRFRRAIHGAVRKLSICSRLSTDGPGPCREASRSNPVPAGSIRCRSRSGGSVISCSGPHQVKLGVPVCIQTAAALDRMLSLDVVSCSYGVSRSLRSRTRLTVRPRPTFCMPKAATCGPDCGFWLAAHKNAAYGDLAQRPAGPQ